MISLMSFFSFDTLFLYISNSFRYNRTSAPRLSTCLLIFSSWSDGIIGYGREDLRLCFKLLSRFNKALMSIDLPSRDIFSSSASLVGTRSSFLLELLSSTSFTVLRTFCEPTDFLTSASLMMFIESWLPSFSFWILLFSSERILSTLLSSSMLEAWLNSLLFGPLSR